MKQKEVKALHNKTVDELKNAVSDLRTQIVKLEMDIVTGREKNTAKKKELGRDLARNLTLLSVKQQVVVQSPVEEQDTANPKSKATSKKEEKKESDVNEKKEGKEK